MAKEIAHFHHESGMAAATRRTRGDGIPLSARLMALATFSMP